MCGIVGIFYRDAQRPAELPTVQAMCAAIVHRGPDDEGQHVDRNIGIGMRRLSIVDLAGGRQPMFNDDRSIAVVFNGEIFNCGELRQQLTSLGHRFQTRSDTEVLVRGYEEWGQALPERLNGMFAFSILDRREDCVFIARDHIGVKPLYVYEDSEKIVWASEIKAILTVPELDTGLDNHALLDFLHLGYVPAPRTMFQRIRKLQPASYLRIDHSGQRGGKYWSLNFSEEEKPVEAWCEEIRALVQDAVRLQLMSDVPLGAFLSGGLDSSAIVASMRLLGVDQISTYAIGFGGPDAFHSELGKASMVAKRFGTEHHEIIVEPNVTELLPALIGHLDEPITDTSFLVTYLVSQLAKESVTVILSGVGGDEIFAGYRRYLGPRLQQLYEWMPATMRRSLILPLLRKLPVDRGSTIKSLLRYARGFAESAELDPPQRYAGYVSVFQDGQRSSVLSPELMPLAAEHGSQQVAEFYDTAPAGDPLNRMLYADLNTSLVDSLLLLTDKMSMAVSLEARVPLLDYRLVELAAKVPPALKLNGMRGLKHIFKAAMRDRLPREVVQQKKQGFGTPISRWFRGSLSPLLADLLSEEQIRKRGYFNPQAVAAIMEDHLQQRADYSEQILALLTFEVWHREFLD